MPKAKRIVIHDPVFLPFVPPTMLQPWTGKAPPKGKKSKKVPHCLTTSTSTSRSPPLPDSAMTPSSLSMSSRASASKPMPSSASARSSASPPPSVKS
ncbi:hypothetical protein GYH30_022452 [Glycine max]|nr:hypothetical protein GYH30_022452 [Glycine max]